MKKKSNIIRLYKYASLYKKLLYISVLFSIIYAVTSVAVGWLTKSFIDDILIPKDTKRAASFCIIYLGVVITVLASYILKQLLFIHIEENVAFQIRNDIVSHILKLPRKYFIDNDSGNAKILVSDDVNRAKSIVTSFFIEIFNSLLIIIIILAGLFLVEWRMALMILPAPILFALITSIFGTKVYKFSMQIQKTSSEIVTLIQQVFFGMEIVKIYLMETLVNKLVKDKLNEQKEKRMGLTLNSLYMNSAWSLVIIPYQIIFLAVGSYLYITKNFASIGLIIAFNSFVSVLIGPTMTILEQISNYSSSKASIERIFDLLESETEEYDGEHLPEKVKGSLVFDSVTFGYNSENPVLKNVSFSINNGDKVLLSGASGSGKTTIFNLITRMYEPDSGSIFLDGHDISSLSVKSLRNCISVVHQETYLFSGSIKENLLLAKPNASDEEIISAAQKAQIHEYIMTLPEGYETLVGEGGKAFSGGEAQRIGIARAILKEAKILLLDEATSALDVETESLFWDKIFEVLHDTTVIIISHKPDMLIKRVNKVYSLSEGVMKEVSKESK